MIVSWMLYSLVVALLLASAAGPLERALRLGRRPGRWAWVAAMAGAVLVPVVGLLLAGRSAEPVAVLGPVTPVAAPAASALSGVTRGFEAAAGPLMESLEGPVLGLWAVASLGLLALFGASALRLGRTRRRWTEQFLEGERVLVSQDVGPAVLGLLRPRIVLPGWLMDRGEEARRLIVRHEREHCRARDPVVVLLAGLVTVLMPWNAPLWWCLRRLRLAVEVDCDERVLRAEGPEARRRYGRLLLEVGRRPLGPVRALAAFAERRSALERRIRALTDRLPEHRARRAVGLAALGAMAILAACVVPAPDALESSLEPELSGQVVEVPAAPAFTPYTEAPEILNRGEVQRALVREYPPMLRNAGIGASVDVWLRIDERGRVVGTRLQASSGHEALDRAAMRVGAAMSFSPARNGDRVVPVWISMPIRFEVRGAAEAVRSPEEPSPNEQVRVTAEEAPPEPPRRGAQGPLAEGPVFTPYTVPPQVTNREVVQRALVDEYPPLLRDAGIGGTVDVWFLIDASGRVADVRVAASSGHEALDRAALRVAEAMEFEAALNRGEAVPVWMSLPVKFTVR